jgi:hypothetical protein
VSRHEVHVSTGSDGVLAGWPVREGGLADAGSPLARPNPEVSA